MLYSSFAYFMLAGPIVLPFYLFFYLTTTMDVDAGIDRKLPAMPEEAKAIEVSPEVVHEEDHKHDHPHDHSHSH